MSYTSTELRAVMATRQLIGVESVFAGLGLPLLAAALAQKTHAPDMLIAVEGGSIGAEIIRDHN
mgnify:CR=1 FL=1